MLTPKLIALLNTINTREDLQEAYAHLKKRAKLVEMNRACAFNIGQTVSFDSRGRRVHGIVTDINQTTVTVMVQDSIRGPVKWRVAATLLQPVQP